MIEIPAKVCLSLLGTWSGKSAQKWNAKTSNLLQVRQQPVKTGGGGGCGGVTMLYTNLEENAIGWRRLLCHPSVPPHVRPAFAWPPQVFISLQGLVLGQAEPCDPTPSSSCDVRAIKTPAFDIPCLTARLACRYYLEAGYDRYRGTQQGASSSSTHTHTFHTHTYYYHYTATLTAR